MVQSDGRLITEIMEVITEMPISSTYPFNMNKGYSQNDQYTV